MNDFYKLLEEQGLTLEQVNKFIDSQEFESVAGPVIDFGNSNYEVKDSSIQGLGIFGSLTEIVLVTIPPQPCSTINLNLSKSPFKGPAAGIKGFSNSIPSNLVLKFKMITFFLNSFPKFQRNFFCFF